MYVRDIDDTLDGLGVAWGALFEGALKAYQTDRSIKQAERQTGLLEQQFRLEEARAKADRERAAKERAARVPVRAAITGGKLPGWVLPTAAIAGGALLLLPRLLKK